MGICFKEYRNDTWKMGGVNLFNLEGWGLDTFPVFFDIL